MKDATSIHDWSISDMQKRSSLNGYILLNMNNWTTLLVQTWCFNICDVLLQPSKTCQNYSKFVRIYWNRLQNVKIFRFCWSVSKHEICYNMSKPVITCYNVSKLATICCNTYVSISVETCQNPPKLIKTG